MIPGKPATNTLGNTKMKTRQERELELQNFMQSQQGKDFIVEQYKKAKGIHEGVVLTGGLLFSSMIQEILDAEYPEQP